MIGDPVYTNAHDYSTALERARAHPDRLRAVYGHAFLRKTPTDQLNAVCRSAASLLKAPGSDLVLLGDEERRVIASYRYGGWLPPVTSMPVQESICQHNLLALREGGSLDLGDTTADERVCNLATVTEHGVRAYLGVPVAYSGQVVGALCVLDQEVRVWSSLDKLLLMGFASEAMALASIG